MCHVLDSQHAQGNIGDWNSRTEINLQRSYFFSPDLHVREMMKRV